VVSGKDAVFGTGKSDDRKGSPAERPRQKNKISPPSPTPAAAPVSKPAAILPSEAPRCRASSPLKVISSSARDLPTAIAEGAFREDLFHRLSVVPIRVPTLAERREDIPELISFFMDQVSTATGMPP